MSIHKIFKIISPYFRGKRFVAFQTQIKPRGTDRVLDVGGYPETWTPHEPCVQTVEILNIHAIDFDPLQSPQHGIKTVIGDACSLGYADQSFDIVFSNSVIEHVGTWENQVRFANEARRVGGKLWIQTPAREFFIEPHYIAPFVHWLPKAWQKRLLRHFTLWGWISKPNAKQVDEIVDEIRLLSLSEMKVLFPDCEIFKERFLYFFIKSYTAFRK